MENTQYQIQEEKKRSKQLQAVAEEAKKASDDLADQLLSVKEDKLIAEEEQKTATKVIIGHGSIILNQIWGLFIVDVYIIIKIL